MASLKSVIKQMQVLYDILIFSLQILLMNATLFTESLNLLNLIISSGQFIVWLQFITKLWFAV